jgi:hypothetical protein
MKAPTSKLANGNVLTPRLQPYPPGPYTMGNDSKYEYKTA